MLDPVIKSLSLLAWSIADTEIVEEPDSNTEDPSVGKRIFPAYMDVNMCKNISSNFSIHLTMSNDLMLCPE
jgi:hypothetical protein